MLILAGRDAEAAELLAPHLPKSARWRSAWMQLASSSDLSSTAAVTWLGRVTPLIPATAADEQIVLARSWYDLAMKYHDKTGFQAARDILKPLMTSSEFKMEVSIILASSAENLGDLATAEAAYRRALQTPAVTTTSSTNPALTLAKNNLAMVLLNAGDPARLAEARIFAEQAVATSPNVASFHDTLARVLNGVGDRKAAIGSFRNALKIDPSHLESLIGLADTLIRDNQRDQAILVLDQIDTLVKAAPRITGSLQQELQRIRRALSSPVTAPAGR